MDSQMIFTLKDFLLFVLWGYLVVLLVYVILILRRALLVVKQVNQIVDGNRSSIDQTLEIVPGLAKNVESITDEVAHDVQAFRSTVDNIAETTSSVTGTINENKGFVEGLSSFMHTVAIGKAVYDKYFGSKVKEFSDIVEEVERTIKDETKDS